MRLDTVILERRVGATWCNRELFLLNLFDLIGWEARRSWDISPAFGTLEPFSFYQGKQKLLQV